MNEKRDYLGDGVYASFDGMHIWLSTMTTSGEHRIALEGEVLAALFRYVERVSGRVITVSEEEK